MSSFYCDFSKTLSSPNKHEVNRWSEISKQRPSECLSSQVICWNEVYICSTSRRNCVEGLIAADTLHQEGRSDGELRRQWRKRVKTNINYPRHERRWRRWCETRTPRYYAERRACNSSTTITDLYILLIAGKCCVVDNRIYRALCGQILMRFLKNDGLCCWQQKASFWWMLFVDLWESCQFVKMGFLVPMDVLFVYEWAGSFLDNRLAVSNEATCLKLRVVLFQKSSLLSSEKFCFVKDLVGCAWWVLYAVCLHS